MVKFYAPWCGHCKAMAPKYVELAKKIRAENLEDVIIAECDASSETEISSRFGIEGFPTIKLFIDGKPVDYQGEREVDDMYNFIKKRMESPLNIIESDEKFAEVENAHLAFLVILPQDDQELLITVTGTAYNFDNLTFNVSFDNQKTIKYTGEQHKICMVLFKDFDEGKVYQCTDETLTSETIKTFINNNMYPIIQNFDRAAAERIFGGELSAIFFFTDKE